MNRPQHDLREQTGDEHRNRQRDGHRQPGRAERLGQLAAHQQGRYADPHGSERLVADVHALAYAYGWREGDVLALTPARREVYLELTGG